MLKRATFYLFTVMLFTLILTPAVGEVSPLNWDLSSGRPVPQKNYISNMEYQDESIHVRIESGVFNDTTYYVAYIDIVSPTQLRTIAAGKEFDSGMVMNGVALAKRANAVVALNGDYYSYYTDGYLVRQSKLYRNSPNVERDILLIDDQGDFHIVCQATKDILTEDYGDLNVVNSFNFGPGLVVDGMPVTGFFDVGNAAFDPKQRACIAQTGPLSYFALVCEGMSMGENSGLTIAEFAELAAKLGAENAYNLDGGNSTMLIFKNDMLNTKIRVREISDMIYFATLVE